MPEPTTAVKPCTVCGIDCSGKARVKDQQGRYMCQDCFEKAKKTKQIQKAPPAVADPVRARAPAAAPAASDNAFLLDLGTKQSSGTTVSKNCPECGRSLAANAVVCIACGFHLGTGKRLPVKVTKAKAAKEGSTGPKISDGAAASMIFCVIGGLIGAAVGCGIWTAVTVSSGRQFGIVAWAVGGLTGAGCAMGARGWAGFTSGAVGGIMGLVAVGLGRYFAFSMILEQMGLKDLPVEDWYFQTLTPFDAIWGILALATAYRVGAQELGGT